VHVLEEAPGFTEWVNRYASDRYTADDFVRNNALGLALTVGASLGITRYGRRRAFTAYYSVILAQQALWNTAFHAGTTAAWRAYSPGLVSALGLFLPIWWYLTQLGLREGLLTRRGAVRRDGGRRACPRRSRRPTGVLPRALSHQAPAVNGKRTPARRSLSSHRRSRAPGS
jgi:hypothetical protein